MHLSPRLQTIFDYVEPCCSVTDVGTDHGYIPIALIESGTAVQVTATDIRPKPLENAKKDAVSRGFGNRIRFLCCDGLSACSEESADTIIISGLGGETIRSILANAPWSSRKTLILQPQSKLFELRSYLADVGQKIIDAKLAYDNGFIYVVWLVKPGVGQKAEWIDASLIEKRDPLLPSYLRHQIKRKQTVLCGLSRSSLQNKTEIGRAEEELSYYHKLLRSLTSISD